MVERGKGRVMIGVVTSDKMAKTVVVQVARRVRHPRYDKYLSVRNKHKAHDESGQCHVGDKVEIIESRPLSRDKCWRVLRVIERAPTV